MGVHNGAHRFNEAIKSIVEQTYTNWEFVICDDGSSDGSYELLKKYEESDNRFKVIQNNGNKGLPYTLNHCLECCTGEYIARMDDDDYCYPDRFEKQVKFLEEHADVSFISSCVDLWDGKNDRTFDASRISNYQISCLSNTVCTSRYHVSCKGHQGCRRL